MWNAAASSQLYGAPPSVVCPAEAFQIAAPISYVTYAVTTPMRPLLITYLRKSSLLLSQGAVPSRHATIQLCQMSSMDPYRSRAPA